jgi:uncharacterized protein (DUF2126 family)
VTKPYSDAQWSAHAETLGHRIDADLVKLHDVRLTMGGEPTYVATDDRDGAEWNTDRAHHRPPTKRGYATELLAKLRALRPGGFAALRSRASGTRASSCRAGRSMFWRADGETDLAPTRPVRR